jgi:hypothetical protein
MTAAHLLLDWRRWPTALDATVYLPRKPAAHIEGDDAREIDGMIRAQEWPETIWTRLTEMTPGEAE